MRACDVLVLSPHLDDAALSCGGMIARAVDRGQRVLVLSICTGAPTAPLSSLAASLHARWGVTTDEVIARRAAEDAAAMEVLGAAWAYAGLLDAIYRPPYRTFESLHAPAPDDPLPSQLAEVLRRCFEAAPRAAWFAPLGIGRHVDHLLVHQAARALPVDLTFYEDTPYVYMRDGILDETLARLPPMRPSMVDVSDTLDRRIRAIACYQSQLEMLFGDGAATAPVAAIDAAVGTYARSLAASGAERFWTPAPDAG